MNESRVRRRKHKPRKKVALFARILINLTLPLLCLILVFTAIQLTAAVKTLNESYHLKGRFAFESIHRTLEMAVKSGQDLINPRTLAELTRHVETAHEGVAVNIYSLIHRSLVLSSGSSWNSFDAKALEESLYQKQQGRSALVKIEKDARLLSAYIPLENAEEDITMVARIQVPLANIKEALSNSRWTLALMVFLIILTGAAIGYRLSRSIIRPIQILNDATQEILKGNLGKHVQIDTGDEIEDLAHTFNKMSDSLEDMKKRAQDANPLTGLPGNQGIFQEVKKRLHERQKFVLFHTDLDRFKVFNDHFGLGKGDEAIKLTAELLLRARDKAGSKDDFIGHQGGDDFVIVTRPNTAVQLGEYVTKVFDQEVVKVLYPKEDVERGYTLQLDRRRLAETGEEIMTKFPLLALSLAGVSNVKKDFADYFDCMSAAVTVKKEVKKIIESSYMIKE